MRLRPPAGLVRTSQGRLVALRRSFRREIRGRIHRVPVRRLRVRRRTSGLLRLGSSRTRPARSRLLPSRPPRSRLPQFCPPPSRLPQARPLPPRPRRSRRCLRRLHRFRLSRSRLHRFRRGQVCQRRTGRLGHFRLIHGILTRALTAVRLTPRPCQPSLRRPGCRGVRPIRLQPRRRRLRTSRLQPRRWVAGPPGRALPGRLRRIPLPTRVPLSQSSMGLPAVGWAPLGRPSLGRVSLGWPPWGRRLQRRQLLSGSLRGRVLRGRVLLGRPLRGWVPQRRSLLGRALLDLALLSRPPLSRLPLSRLRSPRRGGLRLVSGGASSWSPGPIPTLARPS